MGSLLRAAGRATPAAISAQVCALPPGAGAAGAPPLPGSRHSSGKGQVLTSGRLAVSRLMATTKVVVDLVRSRHDGEAIIDECRPEDAQGWHKIVLVFVRGITEDGIEVPHYLGTEPMKHDQVEATVPERWRCEHPDQCLYSNEAYVASLAQGPVQPSRRITRSSAKRMVSVSNENETALKRPRRGSEAQSTVKDVENKMTSKSKKSRDEDSLEKGEEDKE